MNIKRHFKKINQQVRIMHTDPNLLESMSETIISWVPPLPHEYVVVCIGTDRSTGDALGPLTGTFFSEMKPKHLRVYGTLHHPVHATNLSEYVDLIDKSHRNPYIIAIDASLGKTTSVGHLISRIGPLKPGAALEKPLPPVGDMHITGVVNMGGFMEQYTLQSTRLSVVTDMARQISNVLHQIDQRL